MHGEILPGCEQTPEHEKFSIRFGKDAALSEE